MIPPGFIDGTALIGCGVYILAWRGEIVYVGQSQRLVTQINAHVYSRWKFRKQKLDGRVIKGVVFDQIWFQTCGIGEVDSIERELIRKYAPRYNKKDKPLPLEIAEIVAQLTPIISEPMVYIRRRL